MSLPGNPPHSFEDVRVALDELAKFAPPRFTSTTKPDEAQWEGRFIYVTDTQTLEWSDGSLWNPV